MDNSRTFTRIFGIRSAWRVKSNLDWIEAWKSCWVVEGGVAFSHGLTLGPKLRVLHQPTSLDSFLFLLLDRIGCAIFTGLSCEVQILETPIQLLRTSFNHGLGQRLAAESGAE